jgi:hypothetical protein
MDMVLCDGILNHPNKERYVRLYPNHSDMGWQGWCPKCGQWAGVRVREYPVLGRGVESRQLWLHMVPKEAA